MPKTYSTIDAIKAATRQSRLSKYWFSPDSMAFWNCEIETGVIAGRYFVTSERPDIGDPKRYTIRMCTDTGEIETIGEHRQYETVEAAKLAILDMLSES